MPRVPTLDQFQANSAITQPVPTGQASAANLPSYGNQQAIDMGRGLMSAGGELSKIVIQDQMDVNEAITKDADNVAAQNVSKIMNNPEGGFLTLKGRAAVEGRDATRAAVQDALSEAGEGLQNDMQRRMYREVAQRRLQMALQQIDVHASEQTRVWNETETTARIGNAADGAVGNWYAWNQPAGPNNPFTTNRDTMVAETKALVKLKGFGEDSEVSKAAVTAALTKMHQNVIASMVSAEKVTEANEYFKRNYNEIDPGDRPKLEGELRKAEGAVIASGAADQIWAQEGPKRYGEATDLFKMEAKAREMFPNDPMKAKATIDELRSRSSAFDKSESEFITSNVNAVGQLLVAGKSKKDIQLSPAFMQLPGAKQHEVLEAIDNHEYTLQQRGYAAVDRAYMLGQRARTQRLQAEEDLERKNAPYLFALSDPRRLATMTREEVASTWTKVGIGNTNSLLQKWDALQNKGQGAAIMSNDDAIKGSAVRLGILPATGKPNDDQALGFINYQSVIAERVRAFETTELQGRRDATPEEVRKIVQQVEIDRVYKPRTLLPDKQVPLVNVKPEDLKDIYVKVDNEEIHIASIPMEQRVLIIQALRAANLPINEQSIATYWVRGGKKK